MYHNFNKKLMDYSNYWPSLQTIMVSSNY